MRFTTLIVLSSLLFAFNSCKKDNNKTTGTITISGELSELGETGVTIYGQGGTISGVSEVLAEVTEVNNDVSKVEATAIVSNSIFKNALENIPGAEFNGDTLSISAEVKIATDGIEIMDGPLKGVVVNYSSKVGDEYEVPNSSKTRKVISVTDDEVFFQNNVFLKSGELTTTSTNNIAESTTIGVEEQLTNSPGIQSLIYYFNNIDGLVGVDLVFDDETTASYSFYTLYITYFIFLNSA